MASSNGECNCTYSLDGPEHNYWSRPWSDGLLPVAKFALLCKHSEYDETEGLLVFKNFSLAARSCSGSKLIITAWQVFHTNETLIFGGACLFSFFLESGVVMFHVFSKYRVGAKVAFIGMGIVCVVGTAILVCLQLLLPEDHVCHTIVVPVLNIIIVLIDCPVQLITQVSFLNSDISLGVEVSYITLIIDVFLASVETAINIYRWKIFTLHIHDKFGVQKILIKVFGCLAFGITIIQFGWIIYSCLKKITRVSAREYMAGIVSKVSRWLRIAYRVFIGGEEEQHIEAAMEGEPSEDDNDEEHVMMKQETTQATTEIDEDGNAEEHAMDIESAIENGDPDEQASEEGAEAGIVSKVSKWLKNAYRFVISGEEELPMEGEEDGDVENQMEEGEVESGNLGFHLSMICASHTKNLQR